MIGVMRNETSSTERKVNIWAPWRMEYIESLSGPDDGCFLCHYRDNPQEDSENLVVWRGQNCFVVMNRFPYTGGHLLVSPLAHVASLSDLDRDTMCEIMEMTRDCQELLSKAVNAQGFNVGINVGRCAGAGLPGHLHVHVVPRWEGDTNFMPVFGDVRVIPQSLDRLYEQLISTCKEQNLPRQS